jgi:hypothetical protein
MMKHPFIGRILRTNGRKTQSIEQPFSLLFTRELSCRSRFLSRKETARQSRPLSSSSNYNWSWFADHKPLSHSYKRNLSTSTRSSAKGGESLSLLNLVKPFLLKCHPDVHQAAPAKQINLQAIQNLNSYIDTVEAVLSGKLGRAPSESLVEIDFIIAASPRTASKKAQTTMSRRKVELVLPPWSWSQPSQQYPSASLQKVKHHAMREISKLLRVAGLPTPVLESDSSSRYNDGDGFNNNKDQHDLLHSFLNIQPDYYDDDNVPPMSRNPHLRPHFDHNHNQYHRHRRPLSRYEQNRSKFVSQVNWQKYNQLYKDAVADMQADLATQGSISSHLPRRRRFIASILANIRLQEELSMMEQLIVFRRLSLLLEQHFDDLHMEDFGNYWESCRFIIGPSRQYNVSASALYKRRQRKGGDNGYSFTLHPDDSVTVVIPVDFRDEELLEELDRNVWDFYNVLGDGMEEILVDDEEDGASV